MKKLLSFIIFLALAPCAFSQLMSTSSNEQTYGTVDFTTNTSTPQMPEISMSEAVEIRKNDPFLALVPGAVQMRRKWPIVAGSIWGGMAITGGLAIYEQFHLVKLRNNMDGDPSNADWYDHEIRQAKKVRNGSLIALGGIYVANYVSALLLPDKNPKTSWITLYADPQGSIGLTYALNF